MPSVVPIGSHLQRLGVRHHRRDGVGRAHSLLAVSAKVLDRGCSFAHGGARVWAIIAARMTKMRGLLLDWLDWRVLTPPRSKEGALWRRRPSPALGLNWRAMSIARQRCWS
jgi:hypothetical protein